MEVVETVLQKLLVGVVVIRVGEGVTAGVAPVEIEAVPVFVGLMVEVIVTVGEFVTRAVTEAVMVFDGVVVMVLVGVLEAVIEADGV